MVMVQSRLFTFVYLNAGNMLGLSKALASCFHHRRHRRRCRRLHCRHCCPRPLPSCLFPHLSKFPIKLVWPIW